MKENILNFETLGKGYKDLIEQVKNNNSCSIFGVQNSMRPALVSSFGKKILYLTADNLIAKNYDEQFSMMGLKTVRFSSISDSFIYKKASSTELYAERTIALYKILTGKFDVVVIPIQALFDFLPSISDFKSHTISLKSGKVIEPEKLEIILTEAGYKREDLIAEPGQFSRRGDVFDIFPINSTEPFRIDFFDTEIESIKIFDVSTQRGTKAVNEIKICPYSDLFLTSDEINMLISTLEKLKLSTSPNDVSLQTIFTSQIDEIISRLELRDRSYCLDVLAPYLNDFRSTIFDYLSASGCDYVTVFDECKQLYDSIKSYSQEVGERIQEFKNSKTLISGEKPCFFSTKQVLDCLKEKCSVAFLKITNSNKFFESKAVFNFKTLPGNRFTHNLKEFYDELRGFLLKKFSVIIFAGEKQKAEELKKQLNSHGFDLDNQIDLTTHGICVLSSGYQTGFVLPEEKIVVIGTYDIFAKPRNANKLKVSRDNVFSVPKVGDYVVHHYHGIGLCEGVTKLSGNFGTQDYVVIRYAGGDTLYVPTSHMDMLDRFSGAEKPSKLSKIGGQDFSNVKNKVKASIKKLAINLIELYAKREKTKGFAFSEDTDIQREFENSFPFTETEDQLSSSEEIKRDMESSKVMDRLLCGDVGFGKTEVALRAAFKAIVDGKQVAFIAPTTILSEQHYNTARSRMMNFGVSVEVLNRFKTQAEIKKTLKGISSGKVDLIFGTHRVFSKDVEFKNLGLIILDEEQKFGVEDKEKLKVKYPNVDVLTLSATPIPRTLSMSLSGIRDISIISTPPSERMGVQTYVTDFSDALVRDAINRELSRDGQVFVLFNSVEKIYAFAEKIKALVPGANVLVAHGQMNSKTLENVIYDFYHKKGDILVCTTIIENGIDIENANTLIVYDSDKLGLSQLYQIRGRVGRGSKMAYAYFTYQGQKILTEEAYKRLDALSEFCEFGSGFKLAMRDLEIRGGGNIFGAEQSGHLQKIGYDMYAKLLADTVKELMGEKISEEKDVAVRVAVDSYIPEEYISTSEDRMVAYKRISSVESLEDCQKLTQELNSVYGKVPSVVSNLISVSLVRKLAGKISAIEVHSYGAEVDIIFEKSTDITSNEEIAEAIYKFRMNCTIDLSSKPMIKFKSERLCSENFELVKKFLIKATEKLAIK